MIETRTSRIFFSDLLLILSIVLLFLLFLPYLNNTYWFDDALNYQVYWMIQKADGNLIDFSWRVVKHWFLNAGRPMLIFFPSYSLFYVFHDLTALRTAHFFIILINTVTWGLVLYRLNVDRLVIFIWAVLFFGLFQVHAKGLDPIAGFAFHFQILGIQLSILLLMLLRWMSTDGGIWGFVWVLCLWLFFMGFYEINAIFIPIAFILILLKKNNSSYNTKKALSFLIGAFILYLIVYILIYKMAPENYVGSKPGLSSKIFLAYLKQLSASFPASAYLGAVSSELTVKDTLGSMFGNNIALTILILGTILFFISSKLIRDNLNIGKEVIFLSLSMVFFPAIFPAISSRYQNEVSWGVGTLPVYYQWIGMSFLLVYIFFKFQSRFKNNFLIFVTSVIFGAYLSFSYTANVKAISSGNAPWSIQREKARSAFQQGLLSQANSGDIIELRNCAHYINSNFIFQYTNKRVYVPSDDYQWFPENPRNSAQRFYLDCSKDIYSLQPMERVN